LSAATGCVIVIAGVRFCDSNPKVTVPWFKMFVAVEAFPKKLLPQHLKRM
jgi:hypothetical protein